MDMLMKFLKGLLQDAGEGLDGPQFRMGIEPLDLVHFGQTLIARRKPAR